MLADCLQNGIVRRRNGTDCCHRRQETNEDRRRECLCKLSMISSSDRKLLRSSNWLCPAEFGAFGKEIESSWVANSCRPTIAYMMLIFYHTKLRWSTRVIPCLKEIHGSCLYVRGLPIAFSNDYKGLYFGSQIKYTQWLLHIQRGY